MQAESAHADESAEQRILKAAMTVLAREGIAGVSMRAVAREASVAVGLANYYYDSKIALISAALRRIGESDLELVTPLPGRDPTAQLTECLERALDNEYLDAEYLSLRLQLWSLAGVDPLYAEINQTAQRRYLAGLQDLIGAACPQLEPGEIERRAADVLVEQNGVWLTAVLIPDQAAVARALERCIDIALAPTATS